MDVGCGNPVCHKRFTTSDAPIICETCKTISYCNEACLTANLELHRRHCTPRTQDDMMKLSTVKERLYMWMDVNGAYYRFLLYINELVHGQARVLRVPMDHPAGKRMVILASQVQCMPPVIRNAYAASDARTQFITVFETPDIRETAWTRLYNESTHTAQGTLGELGTRVQDAAESSHMLFILSPSADNCTITSVDFLPWSVNAEPNLAFLSQLFHHNSLTEIAQMFGIQ